MASNKIMIWTDAHDVVLGRQVMVIRPYQHRKGSKESANGWNEITQYLQGYVELSFCVSSKSVRDHFKHLVTKRKRVISQEKWASGIDANMASLQPLLLKYRTNYTSFTFNFVHVFSFKFTLTHIKMFNN